MVNSTVKSLESLIDGVGKIKSSTANVALSQEKQNEGSNLIDEAVKEIFMDSGEIVKAATQQKAATNEISGDL